MSLSGEQIVFRVHGEGTAMDWTAQPDAVSFRDVLVSVVNLFCRREEIKFSLILVSNVDQMVSVSFIPQEVITRISPSTTVPAFECEYMPNWCFHSIAICKGRGGVWDVGVQRWWWGLGWVGAGVEEGRSGG